MGGGVRSRSSHRSHSSTTTTASSSSPATISSAAGSSKTALKGGVSLEVRRQLACRRAWRALDFDDLESESDPDSSGSSLDMYDEEEFWSQVRHQHK
mmetsp:Transcript_5928/g.9941  ORF Transcript_5928/g.9941 Transcript_5928/m.9941 type:complete len:97 (+) Transcript_5928:153-443(+)|eukprot:CAMPEP_0197729254 /NCGR_PEP_ID=MMETSP1434-20131217/29916_1 /TAXON_ID=265543 /ORGANISM="Minutocellus polymorphus, Strain CCMP3303" /LENGTH=96 /DNA_ID=CAMNT_0043315857 /DNA_START=142 /DNA_END=432 /DNA_ORIENTATION=+